MKTLTAAEAAAFLKIEITTLCSRAKAGQIPGAKDGRAWVFIEDDLVQHLRTKYRFKHDAEGNAWGTAAVNITPIFGFSSDSEARAFEKALAPAPKKQRRGL